MNDLELLSVDRIWDQGAHNAFTDLVRWRNAWWCPFREGGDHGSGDGIIRVIASTDG
ncbi:MAG: exo-alpha-sialidase, partial [Armatimonadia bacterium]|nr:exo-alpha-sialidase [Armatimonadia bacterium]